MFVNDTLGLDNTLRIFEEGDRNYTSVIGVMILYYPSIYFGKLFNLLINFFIIYFSLMYFKKSLKLLFEKDINSICNIVSILLLTNFYIMAVIFFPNKELPLIFISNIFIYYVLINKKYLISFLLIPLTFLFRDGFAAILIIATISLFLIDKGFKAWKIILFTYIFLSLFDIGFVSDLFMGSDFYIIFKRNSDYGESLGTFLSGLPSYIAYSLKIINNFSSAAFRPQIFDENGRFYFVANGLWQFGIISFLSISGAFINLKKENRVNYQKIIFLCIFLLLGISFSSFTQPRYLFPLFFWLVLLINSYINKKYLILFLLIIFNFVIFFYFIGLGAPLGTGVDQIGLI